MRAAGLRHGLYIFENDVTLIYVSTVDHLVGDRASTPHAHTSFGYRRGKRGILTSGRGASLRRLSLREGGTGKGSAK